MKKLLITLLAVLTISTTAFAAEPITGGWEATTDATITDEAKAVFEKAVDVSDYEPIGLLSTQVVAGTNYCFLCRVTSGGYAHVYVYEDLQGNAEILDVQTLEFGVRSQAPADGEYAMGETWTVDGQWNLTIDSVEETADRNEYSDLSPAAVYLVTFTYENLGYEDDYSSGLFLVLDNQIVDADGQMGYSYPGDLTLYPNETPVGAKCTGQVCIGVDNPGSFKIYVEHYDGNEEYQHAIMDVEVE